MIDFSKAPEGATHYDDSTKTIGWWRNGPLGWAICDGCLNGVPTWIGLSGCFDYDFKEIPKENKMLIECRTEREVMLCEQVLRISRGEKSQMMINGEWRDLPDDVSHIHKVLTINKFRAKPKKELFVPWEWIDDDIKILFIEDNKTITGLESEKQTINRGLKIMGLKIDLDGIDLPTIVNRPEGK